nr:MAG TPA: Minor structural protein putative tail fiber [Caudoviricetes sp.]
MVYRDGKLVPVNSVGNIKWFRSGVLMSDTTPNITIQANSFQELVNYSFEIWNSKNEKICTAIEFLYKNKNIKDNRIMYKTVNKGAVKPSAPVKYPDSNWTDVLPNDAFTPNKDCYKCILSLLEDGNVRVSYLEKMSNPTDLNIGGRNLFKYGKGDKKLGIFNNNRCQVDENGELYFDMKIGKIDNTFLYYNDLLFDNSNLIPKNINEYNTNNYIVNIDTKIKFESDDAYNSFINHPINEILFTRRFATPKDNYVWDYTDRDTMIDFESANKNIPMIFQKNKLNKRTSRQNQIDVGDYIYFVGKNASSFIRITEITDELVKGFYETTYLEIYSLNIKNNDVINNANNSIDEYTHITLVFNIYNRTYNNKHMPYPKFNSDKWNIQNGIIFGGFTQNEYQALNSENKFRHIRLYIKNIKIEEGDVATNWTPSLEETQEELDNKATNQDIINVNNTITNTNTSLNNLESKVNDEINQNSVKFKEIETKVKTEIDSTKGSITDLIAKTDGNKANLLELTKTVTSINNTIRQIGGDNLIQNSNMYAYDENTLLPSIWETSSAIDTTKKHSITYDNDSNSLNHGCISGRSFDIRNMSVKQKILVTKDNSEILNKIYYSFSCKIKKPNTVKTTIKLYNSNDTLVKEYPIGTSVDYETVSFEKLLPNDLYYYIEFISEGSDTEGTIVTDCVFNIGEYTIPWQLSTGEILNSNLTINQEGITIRSNIYDGDYTIMSPIEFAGYSNNNNNNKEKIFSLNKDITLVRKLHSQDEIQLPPIKMVPVLTGNNKGVAFVKLD